MSYDRSSMKNLIKSFATKRLNSATIVVNGVRYLTRFYLFGKDRRWLNVYIHHFHSSDLDKELHNHPWLFGITIVFDGGYTEQYRDGDVVKTRARNPLSIGFVGKNLFHRVKLNDDRVGAWSIFIAGPRTVTKPEWEFWDPESKRQFYYKEKSHAID